MCKVSDHYLSNEKLGHWFMWNKPFDHKKLSSLPIGINYARQGASLQEWMNRKLIYEQKNKILINFSTTTHPSRSLLRDKAHGSWKEITDVIDTLPIKEQRRERSYTDHSGFITIPVTHPDFYNILSSYQFVLSPRGRGIDCYRTWEALYVGTIPIIKSSSIDELFQDLPVIIVKSWDEINKKFLDDKLEEFSKRTFEVGRLSSTYWINKIKDKQAIIYSSSISPTHTEISPL